MKHIFIAYGNKPFRESLIRLKRMAKRIGLFEEIRIYTPTDLPPYILSSPLMAFNKGGGYWIWKPWIIKDALSKCKDGDVVWYVDAGCSLNKDSNEWETILERINKHNLVCFHYRQDVEYSGWGDYESVECNDAVDIRHWTKPTAIEYFKTEYGKLGELIPKIWGGAIIIKKGIAEDFVDRWLQISLFNPELIADPLGPELNSLPSTYFSHRHDQSIITPLIWSMKESHGFCVLPEKSESEKQNAAIQATRWSTRGSSLLNKIKSLVYIYFNGIGK